MGNMAQSALPENNRHSQNRCYCLNPACQHPENSSDRPVCQACGSELLLQESYRAIKPIGAGGFGRTFLAIDESYKSRRYCVIKQFFPQQQGTNNAEKAAELFYQEAVRLEALGSNSRIPRLIAYFDQDQRQYLIQEFIDGRNLAEELAEEGAFSEEKIRHLLAELLPILEFIHSHQVIHRDIKPENIIRRRQDGSLVLVDFGAAKYVTETTLGKTGTTIGSAAYTAPEQVRGKAVFASDIYSLAVTCIHLLTEVQPFDLFDSGEDTWIWRQYANSQRVQGRQISQKLGQILDKMLQSAINRRYQSASDVLADLNSGKLLPAAGKSQRAWLLPTALLVGLTGIFTFSLMPTRLQQSHPPTYNQSPISSNPNKRVVKPKSPKTAGLFVDINGQRQTFPLKHTEVVAKISGNLSRVEVTQTFNNPFSDPLEAIYTFPLPDEAAVDDMEIKVGDRVIRGLIKKREEAKKIYEEAKKSGKTAGLLEQERDNIFTQSLANIKPGEKIDVTIRYTESLKFEKGNYEFVFPMVVGPRYIPGGDVVKDAGKVNPPTIADERSGQDINVTVEIEGGVPIASIQSASSHQINTTQDGRVFRVQLANQKTIPNKDLILKYQVAGQTTQSTILTQADERGGHFASYLIPAIAYQVNEIVPKDVVFLMDTSGSQSGAPIAQSKELMRQFISGLNPNDTFTIIDFASTTTRLSDKPLTNTPENIQKALDYVNRLQANGGSELFNGINAVLDFPAAPEGRLRSVVLITDGLMGDDNRVIAAVQSRLKRGNRLYSFGVGSSVNRFLVNRVAELGRGTSRILGLDEAPQAVAEKFFKEINSPILTNIEVKWEGTGTAPNIYPANPPDLFANQPLVLFGRKPDKSQGNLRITGTIAGGKRYEKVIPVTFNSGGNQAIAQLWGRARIKELMNQMFQGEVPQKVQEVTNTALNYRLLSKYTAFVAVTEEVRVDPKGKKITKQVPVTIPEGMPDKKDQALVPSSVAIPEPGQIIGNILAILMFGFFFAWKRLRIFKKIKLR